MRGKFRVLLVGLGGMGRPHARAYADSTDFEIVGVVTRRRSSVPAEFGALPYWSDYAEALAATAPDLVVISTYSETHADFAIAAMEAGAHVFVEKPLATNVPDAERVVAAARRLNRKLLVGYILRHHPLWQRLVAEARHLGGPYVFRIALNQPSTGSGWETHKQLMQTVSPIVDCGVHYVDVMAQISEAPAREVRGMGLRLTGEIAPDMYNYGHFQLLFADDSLGWFETGWGPMISDVGQSIMDIISPAGALSLIEAQDGSRALSLRRLGTGKADILMAPGLVTRDMLCAYQRDYMSRVMLEDLDLSAHLDEAVQSLRICLAAEDSISKGKPILFSAPL